MWKFPQKTEATDLESPVTELIPSLDCRGDRALFGAQKDKSENVVRQPFSMDYMGESDSVTEYIRFRNI